MSNPAAMTLRIYQDSQRRWVGRLFIGLDEVGEITPADSPEAVERAALQTGLPLDEVLVSPM